MIAYPFGVGRTRTRVVEAGQGSDVLIFLHGLGARADRWRRNLDAFAAAGYHSYAVDLPGHGFADKGGAFPYGVPGYADFLAEFMRAREIPQAVLVGTSLGGHIAAYTACRRPDLVCALVLVGSLGLGPIGGETRRKIGANVRDTTRAGIEGKLRYVLCDHSLITAEWVEEEYRINNSPGAREAFERLSAYLVDDERGLDRDDVGHRLGYLARTLPVFLVWGAQDAVVPVSVGQGVAAALKDRGSLVTLDAAGHLPYFERPAEFNAAVLTFAQRVTAGSARHAEA